MRTTLIAMALLLGFGLLVGCTKESSPGTTPPEKKTAGKKMSDSTEDGYWCLAHGLPEDECWKCNDEFCEQCKKEGDWCKKHQRPQSQCFKCDPKLIDKWAEKYETRYGKKPPRPEEY